MSRYYAAACLTILVMAHMGLTAGAEEGLALKHLLATAKLTQELALKAENAKEEWLRELGIEIDSKSKVFPHESHLRELLIVRPWSEQYMPQYDAWPATSKPWFGEADSPLLRPLLKHENPELRALAVEVLATLHQPEDVPRIGALLADHAKALPLLTRTVIGVGVPILSPGKTNTLPTPSA